MYIVNNQNGGRAYDAVYYTVFYMMLFLTEIIILVEYYLLGNEVT